MSQIKIIFSDIDGTIADLDTHLISSSTVDAIEQARANGVCFVVSTGRSLGGARMIESQISFDGYACLNGQQCVYEGELIRRQHLDPDDVKVVRDQVAQGLYVVSVAEDDDFYFSGIGEEVERARAAAMRPLEVRDPSVIGEKPVIQVVIQGGPEKDKLLLDATTHLKSARWTPALGDIIPVDGGKEKGMQAFLDRLGVSREECAAFGDGFNDISMLEYAGVGVAMGNASDDVKSHADMVTSSVDDDGIRRAFESLGII